MECAPSFKALVVNVAVPLLSATVPNAIGPSKKVTLPVGVPPGLDTVAVKVTGAVKRGAAVEDVNTVVVGELRICAVGVSVVWMISLSRTSTD